MYNILFTVLPVVRWTDDRRNEVLLPSNEGKFKSYLLCQHADGKSQELKIPTHFWQFIVAPVATPLLGLQLEDFAQLLLLFIRWKYNMINKNQSIQTTKL